MSRSKRVPLVCLLVCVLTWLFLVGRTSKGPPADEVVATVAGAPISSAKLSRALVRRGRPRASGGEERLRVLDELVRFEVILARAREAGIDQRPDVAAAIERLIVSKYREEHLVPTIEPQDVAAADVRRYYHEHAEEFITPERRRGAVIFLKRLHGVAAAELRHRAETVRSAALKEAVNSPTFDSVAYRHSDDRATRAIGGDAGWFRRGTQPSRWGSDVVDALFALAEPGDVSAVVEAGHGCYIVKLSALEPASTRPLAELEYTIRRRVAETQRTAALDAAYARLADGIAVEVFTERLEALDVPTTLGQVPPHGGSQRVGPPALPRG